MKPVVVFISALLFLFAVPACERNEQAQNNFPVAELKNTKIDDVESQHENGNLIGAIFRDVEEIPDFKGYNDMSATIIDIKSPNGDEFAFNHIANEKSSIVILEKIIRTTGQQKVRYQILDTILIENIPDNQFIAISGCRSDTIHDAGLIALVVAEDEKEFYDRIIKAWKADIKTGKIELLKSHHEVTCINEGFGLDGCGGEDDPAE